MLFLIGKILSEIILAFVLILSLNIIILARTGLWSIGHIGFFGLGMLLSGLAMNVGVNPWLAGAMGLAGSAGSAALVGVASLRLKDDYFLILSIGFVYIVHATNLSLSSINGFSGLPRPWPFGTGFEQGMLMLCAMLVPAIVFVLWLHLKLRRSSLDAVCALAQENEDAAQALGVSTPWLRWHLFFWGSLVVCWAGVAFTFSSMGTSPERCSMASGIMLFACMILGGIGTVTGSILGSCAFVLVPRLLELTLVDGLGWSFNASYLAQIIFGGMLIFLLRLKKKMDHG